MKFITKIILLTGGIIAINKIRKINNVSSIGGYNSNAELTRIWGNRLLYSSIPGLGLATAIIDSAKHLYNKNNTY